MGCYTLVEGENNECWSWFCLVRKEVLDLGRYICMISDHHHGLLNGAKEHLEVVLSSFCHKHLKEATEQGSYRQVEGIV
jgi:hypothetical protein